MKLQSLTLLIVALGLFGCEDDPWSIDHVSIAGVDVELWEYSDCSFLMADAVLVSPQQLRRRGFVDVTSADMAKYEYRDTYPGHYGVGLDRRNAAIILWRDGAWVTFVDGRMKAEFDSREGARAHLGEVRGWLEAAGQ